MGFTPRTIDITNYTQFPTDPPSEDNIRQDLEDAFQEVYANVTNPLLAVTDSASGMDLVGMTPIAGLVATTPQEALEELKSLAPLNISDNSITNAKLAPSINIQSDTELIKNKIILNTAVSIGLHGDSVYAGYDGTSFVSETQDQTMQTLLRKFYNNNTLIVNNHAVQGTGVNSEYPTWQAVMSSSTDDVIIINFGINDVQGTGANPAILVDEYKSKLLDMVLIARTEGKIVILDTPNYIIGTKNNAQALKNFAQAMRDVGNYANVSIVDTTYWIEKFLESSPDSLTWIPDNIHFSQELNKWNGRLLASAFINSESSIIGAEDVIGCGTTNFFMFGGSDTYIATENSIVGYSIIGTTVNACILVGEPGIDLYLGKFTFYGGSADANILVNNSIIANVSFNDSVFGSRAAVDEEIEIYRDCEIGVYFITIESNTADSVAINFIKAKETVSKYYSFASGNEFLNSVPQIVNPILTATLAGYNTLVSDVVASNLINDFTIDIVATLAGNEGITLLTHKIGGVGSADPMGGLLFWLNESGGGVLTGSESTDITYGNTVAIGAVDLRAVQHKYTFEVKTTGVINCFVDNVYVGNYTQSKPYSGGRIGFWKVGTGSMIVSSATVRR